MKCPVCNDRFEMVVPNKKYCSKRCQEKARKRRKRERLRTNNLDYPNNQSNQSLSSGF